MNSGGDHKSPTPLKRCPSNVSDVSQISSFSISNKSPQSLYSDYHVGDYVYIDSISGVKYGVIRYAGYVDFSKGYWFGIELSEPNGKNNGTIKGKTYFTCPTNHGIFTQSSKISKSPPIKKTHRLSSAGSMFGSRESISSSVYLKRNGLNTSQESLKSCVSGVSAITGVFKQPPSKTLKNQLLKVRQLETESPSKSTIDRVDNLSKELSILSVQESEQLIKSKIELSNQKRDLEEQCKLYENEINELKITINEEKRLGKELVNQLEEEKKKMEMLEFKMEEEKIARIHLEEEMQKKDKQIDELKRKSDEAVTLKNDENEIEMFELQEDLLKKEEMILQLESSLKTKQNENSNLLERTREFEQTIKVFEQRQENYLNKIDDLNLKIKKYELEKAQLEDALSSTNSQEKSNLNNVTNELTAKNRELDELKEQLTKKSNEIMMLKVELEKVNSKCVKLEEVRSNLEKELELTKVNLTKQIEILEENKKGIVERMSKSELEQLEERKHLVEQINSNKKQLDEYKNKLEKFEKTEQQTNENLKTKEENLNRIEKELTSNRTEIQRLKTDLQNLTKTHEKKDIEIQRLKGESERLLSKVQLNQAEKQQLENELDNLKIKLDDKEGQLNSFNKKKLQFQNEMEVLIRDLSNEKEKNRELLMNSNQMNENQKDQLTNAYNELDQIKKEHEKVNLQLEEQIKFVNNLQNKYTEMDLKAKNLEKSNQELRQQIEQRDRTKEQELDSLREEHGKEINRIETKLISYEANLKKLHDGLIEKDLEINGLQLEHQQKIEQLRLDSQLRSSELEKQIIELKCQLDKEQNELTKQKEELINYKKEENKRLTNQVDEQMNNELYESQIAFLNSVIVDMQSQNDELKRYFFGKQTVLIK